MTQVPRGRWQTSVGGQKAFDNRLRVPHSVHQGMGRFSHFDDRFGTLTFCVFRIQSGFPLWGPIWSFFFPEFHPVFNVARDTFSEFHPVFPLWGPLWHSFLSEFNPVFPFWRPIWTCLFSEFHPVFPFWEPLWHLFFAEFHPVLPLWGPLPPEQHAQADLRPQLLRPKCSSLQHLSSRYN